MRIALVSTPRSGNTWERHLLVKMYNLAAYAEHAPHSLHWDQPGMMDRVGVSGALRGRRRPVYHGQAQTLVFKWALLEGTTRIMEKIVSTGGGGKDLRRP